jgi:hypothetical protein
MLTNLEAKVKKYFTKRLVRSDYIKDTTTFLHLSLLSIVTRTIFNFFITYRLQTNIYVVDIIFSICVTIFFSLSAPFFYMMMNRMLKDDADYFSRLVIEKFWKEGWVFFDYWKARILAAFCILCILILFFVEVNSYMIQEFMGHTLVSSAIVDCINKYRDRKRAEIERKERKKERTEKRLRGEKIESSEEESEESEQEVLTRVLSKSQILETYSPPPLRPKFKDTLDFSIMDDYGLIFNLARKN